MSYYALPQKPFSGPEECSSSEHWDAEAGSCQPGLCPAGETLDASGNCNVPGADEASSETTATAPVSSGRGATTTASGESGGLSVTTIAFGFAALAGLTYWIVRSAR